MSFVKDHYEEMTQDQLVIVARKLRDDCEKERNRRLNAEYEIRYLRALLESAHDRYRSCIDMMRGHCEPYGYECNGIWCTNCNSQVERDDTYCANCGCLIDWEGDLE